jgi:hypothetical protein
MKKQNKIKIHEIAISLISIVDAFENNKIQ